MRVASFGLWSAVGVVLAFVGACGDKSEKDEPECPVGSETCACYRNDTCDDGLECLSDLCIDPGDRGNRGGTPGLEPVGGTAGSPSAPDAGENAGGAPSAGTGGQKPMSEGGAPPSGPTPVSLHGALSVAGTELVDEHGARVKLEGMSSMWLNWDASRYAQNKEGLAWMRDNWSLEVFRIAMGVDAEGGYLEDPATAKDTVNRIVANAIELGLYVIIDWHDHDAIAHQAEASAFFSEMAETWGDSPNVLYEVFNEPLAVAWATELAPYHRSLVATIREVDPDNLILLGTPNWDQDVDVAATNPIAGTNLLYTLHFYACTHGAEYRERARLARSMGLPLFVSEWGATHADGGTDGRVCESEARAWHDWLDQTNISWTAWKLDGCEPPTSCDSSCMFKDRSVPSSGPFGEDVLNGHAPIVIDEMLTDPAPAGGSGGTGGAGTGGRAPTGGRISTNGGTSTGGAPSGGSGTGGSVAVDPFPPDPAGCAFLSSCPECCETVGVYALDTFDDDVTADVVTGFSVSSEYVEATFDFQSASEVGGIFFRLASSESIGSLGIDISGAGGEFELALVRNGGADGCTYTVVGNSLLNPPGCWGLGAGPYAGYPVEQLEVRLRADFSGPATLRVRDIHYGP